MTDYLVRVYRAADAGPVARTFRAAVLATVPEYYAAVEADAWAASADDVAAFGRGRERGLTLVAERVGEVIAFGQLHPEGHIEMLYCSPDDARQGIGTDLLNRLLDESRRARAPVVTADVSRAGRRLFERAGLRVVAEEAVERQGVWIARYRMSTPADAARQPAMEAGATG